MQILNRFYSRIDFVDSQNNFLLIKPMLPVKHEIVQNFRIFTFIIQEMIVFVLNKIIIYLQVFFISREKFNALSSARATCNTLLRNVHVQFRILLMEGNSAGW